MYNFTIESHARSISEGFYFHLQDTLAFSFFFFLEVYYQVIVFWHTWCEVSFSFSLWVFSSKDWLYS